MSRKVAITALRRRATLADAVQAATNKESHELAVSADRQSGRTDMQPGSAQEANPAMKKKRKRSREEKEAKQLCFARQGNLPILPWMPTSQSWAHVHFV